MTARKRAIVIPDIADAPLFPSVGSMANSRQCAVFHSYLGAAAAIRSLWRRLRMGGLPKHKATDQQRCNSADKDFHFLGRSSRGV
jgi:hypothetical protein